jgi:hypothetical protein
MALASQLRSKFVARLDELIHSGEAMPMRQHSRITSASAFTGDKTYRHYELASWPEFVEWRTSCQAVLDQVVPVASLLRRTVEGFSSLSNEPEKVQFAVAFLRSVKREIESGSFDPLVLQVEASVLSDYMTQASALLGELSEAMTHVPAAVLAGASLERSLRTLCEGLQPEEPVLTERGDFIGMNALIDALKRRGAFNELQAKQLRAWSAIRNSAAHGKFDEFTRHQVEQMLDGVQVFLLQHLK